jgi:ribosomal protein S18 acetylase RimI-like enzyme
LENKKVTLKDQRTVILRELQHEDVQGIWSNFNAVVEEKIYLPVYTLVTEDWEMDQWFKDLKDRDNFCIIAEDSSRPSPSNVVGQCTIENLEWEAAGHVSVLGIIVQNGYRNSGLGYALIKASMEEAKQRGKKKLILSTFMTNKMGLALYKKCGFKEVGRYTKQYKIEGKYIDEILMEHFL